MRYTTWLLMPAPGDDADHAATLGRLGLTALPSETLAISDDDLLRRAEQRVAAHESAVAALETSSVSLSPTAAAAAAASAPAPAPPSFSAALDELEAIAGVLEQHVPRKRQVWGGAQAPEKNGFLSPVERVHRPARVYGDDDDDAARRSPPPRPPVTASRCDADAVATLPPPPPPPVRDGKTPGQRELLGVT